MLNKLVLALLGIVLGQVLTAGATTPPSLENQAQAGAPWRLALVAYRDDPGQPSNSRNRTALPPMALQARSTAPVTVQAAQKRASRRAAVASRPDWTRLFKAWENGCMNSPEFDAFEKQFAVFDKQRGLEFGDVKLPAAFKAATGTPTSRHRDDYSFYTLPVTSGRYYGIPVKSIEFYAGHENGIAGKQLVLNASEKEVRKVLKRKKVWFRKGAAPQAVVSGIARETSVTCDHSD